MFSQLSKYQFYLVLLHLKEIFSQYSVLFKELKKGEGE
jgi:hypothetical protein